MFADDDAENTYHRAEEVMVMPISDETCNDDNPRLIRAEWCPPDADLSWRLTSNLPHATFTIYESGEPYCEGIVIDLDEARDKELLAEVGDVLWFVAGIASTMGVSLEEIANANLAKLQSRQQRGVIDGNGDNR